MRVALSGVSHWHATMHLEAFRAAGAEIVAVSDWAGMAEVFGRRQGCPAFEDARMMIERTHPDFVMAMARPREMPETARMLLEIGVPFGIEKPLGLSASEAEPVVELAERRGSFCAVPLVNRYSRIWDHVVPARQTNPDPAALSHAHFRIVNGSPERYVAAGVEWMLDPQASGGGCLRNLGIHGADAFLQLVRPDGYQIRGASVHSRIHHKRVEEAGSILVVSNSGVIATIEAGYSDPTHDVGGDYEFRIALADRYLVDRNSELIVADYNSPVAQCERNITQAERYTAFGKDTLERLSSGRPPIATLRDCYDAMLLIDRAYEAAGIRGYSQ